MLLRWTASPTNGALRYCRSTNGLVDRGEIEEGGGQNRQLEGKRG
jgi:hypothetical protein